MGPWVPGLAKRTVPQFYLSFLGMQREYGEPDSLSVGMGQVSSVWVGFLPRRDRVWGKEGLLYFPEKKDDHPRS